MTDLSKIYLSDKEEKQFKNDISEMIKMVDKIKEYGEEYILDEPNTVSEKELRCDEIVDEGKIVKDGSYSVPKVI